MTAAARLQAQDLDAWLARHPDALLLDARDARAHAAGALPGALRLDGRNHEALLLREPKARPVLIYCYHGNASQTYAQMFRDFGFSQVCDLIGGWAAREARRSAGPEAGRDAHGNTPLMAAAWGGDASQVDWLLTGGADVHAQNADGNTALWLACVARSRAIVMRLAEAGAKLDHQNLAGATALMYAASSDRPDMVQLLLELGADASLQSQDDFTALDMAASIECLRLLRRAA